MSRLLRGQEVAVKILRSIIMSKKVAHAYLFKGPRGCGMEECAREFSKAILCLGSDSDKITASGLRETTSDLTLSCGVCESCQAFSENNHPDLFCFEKEGTSIKIKSSHEMLKESLTRPYLSGRKVFVINEAENMTLEAANALLKLLEEPPYYITFILTTSNELMIPSTIVSRCQVIPFRPLPASVIADILETEHGVSAEDSRLISMFSSGSIDRALWFLSDDGKDALSGGGIVAEIRSNSPVELGLKYSKANSDEKVRVLTALEIHFGGSLARAVHDSGESEDMQTEGKNTKEAITRSIYGLNAVMRARQRLAANTNSFLTLSDLFLRLRGLLTQGSFSGSSYTDDSRGTITL